MEAVGHPKPQNFTVVFDTGSGHLFLPDASCQDQVCLRHRRYNRTLSDSAAEINGDGSAATKERDMVAISYGIGEISGDFVREVVCIGSSSSSEGSHCTLARVILAQQLTAEPFQHFHFDGVLGLGLSALALNPEFHLFSQLSKGDVAPSFGVFLSQPGHVGSQVTFGGQDLQRFSGCHAIVDTGTSLLGVPQTVRHVGRGKRASFELKRVFLFGEPVLQKCLGRNIKTRPNFAGACHGVLGSQPRRKHPAPWRMPISTRLRRILAQSGRTTQWRLCLHLWAQKPCAVAAAAAISACGRAAHWDQSLALYDHWLRHDQPSDPAVLNSTLAACAHAARWVLALTLLEEAKRHHRAFDLLGLNSALNACGRAARWEVSLALLMQLQKQRLADATSVNSTISACDRAAVWQLALSLLYTHRADLVGASAALSACARGAAWASALAVLHAHRANAVSFGAAITACGRSTRWRFALQLLGDALKTTSRASLACFSAAVSACELGAAWEAALVVLSKAARDWPLDRTILNATISSCEKGWQWDRCLALLHATDAVTCGAAAEACASAMRWVEALSLASRVDSVVATAAATRAKEDAQHAVHRRSCCFSHAQHINCRRRWAWRPTWPALPWKTWPSTHWRSQGGSKLLLTLYCFQSRQGIIWLLRFLFS
ncbi:unnamed protein product [Effrenium voratum]|nr:unnamed protein product [Effrenium voratum]